MTKCSKEIDCSVCHTTYLGEGCIALRELDLPVTVLTRSSTTGTPVRVALNIEAAVQTLVELEPDFNECPASLNRYIVRRITEAALS